MPERGRDSSARGRDSAQSVIAPAGTVLAFDFGTRRIGVAVGESSLGLAHPLAEITGEQAERRFAAIAQLIADWKPQHLVVGLPLAADGTPHEVTHRAQRFARQLDGRFGLPVSLVDERYTSVEAESKLRDGGAYEAIREKRIDSAAAQIILQQYFQAHAA